MKTCNLNFFTLSFMVFSLRGYCVLLLFKTNLSFLKYFSNSISAFSSISHFSLLLFSDFCLFIISAYCFFFLLFYFLTLSLFFLLLFVPLSALLLFTIFLNCVLPKLFLVPAYSFCFFFPLKSLLAISMRLIHWCF